MYIFLWFSTNFLRFSVFLGVNKGVCRDENAHDGGTNDNQIQTFSRDDGVTKVMKLKFTISSEYPIHHHKLP